MIDLRMTVFNALDNAFDNGYDPAGLTVEQNAIDLQTFDSDLEDKTTAELAPHIQAWLEWPQRRAK